MNSPVQEGDRHARVAEPIPRPMVLQISRRVGAEISKTGNVRADPTWDWENSSGAVSAARRGVGGRARAAGPRASAVGDPAEVQCCEYGGVSEGEVGHPDPPGVSRAATQLHGLPLLGEGVLREHGRFGGRCHPRVHPAAGNGRDKGFLTRMYARFGAMAGPPCSDRGCGCNSLLSGSHRLYA